MFSLIKSLLSVECKKRFRYRLRSLVKHCLALRSYESVYVLKRAAAADSGYCLSICETLWNHMSEELDPVEKSCNQFNQLHTDEEESSAKWWMWWPCSKDSEQPLHCHASPTENPMAHRMKILWSALQKIAQIHWIHWIARVTKRVQIVFVCFRCFCLEFGPREALLILENSSGVQECKSASVVVRDCCVDLPASVTQCNKRTATKMVKNVSPCWHANGI